MDELEELRQRIEQRKLKQNERRAKAGKPPMHKIRTVRKRGKGFHKTGLPMPESGNIDDSAMSFDEWSAIGYAVKKGEKAHSFDPLAVAQFTLDQVRKINPAWANYRKKK